MDRFKAIEGFISVAKCGSYSRAAKQLGMSRALMSHRIIELETYLGVRLFNRNTHGLSLTDAGVEYLASCQNIISDLEAADLSLIENRRVARGSLRLLTSQTFGTVVLASITAQFMTRFPEIEVFVATSFLRHQAMELIGGGFDLALRTTELADSSLIARKIAPLDTYVVASPDYLARAGVPEVLQDLNQHRCLVTGIEPVHRWQLLSHSGVETVRINGVPVGNLTTITRATAIAGLGIALLPEYCVARDLATGKLSRVLPDYKAEQRWVLAVYPQERTLPLKTRLFLEFLAEQLHDRPWQEIVANPLH